MTFGRKRSLAPSFSLDQIRSWSEKDATLLLRFLQHLFEVDHHHDAGLNRRAEERDVADPHRDAEIVAEQILQEDPAGQRERHREDDVRGFLGGAIDDIEQQEDDAAERRAR